MSAKDRVILKMSSYQRRLNWILEKQNRYASITDDLAIHDFQINMFNNAWGKTVTQNPFYKFWAERHNLPKHITSVEQLSGFPVLTKKDLQENQELIFRSLKNYSTVSTGGSSGEPTKFPTSGLEKDFEYANTYIGRGWWDISPLDETVLFWGHSHLFGTGMKGVINNYKRSFYDWLINISRFNAYDMTAETLDEYVKSLVKRNPKVIIGYTSILFKLAKYILDKGVHLGNKNNLKAVIVTSETVYDQDITYIEKAFKVPVVLEYGMAETSVIAYSRGDSRKIELLWDSFIGLVDEKRLTITTLNDRLFPLINYDTDDRVEVTRQYRGSVLGISEILGRTQELVTIRTTDNQLLSLSGILIIHLLKGYPGLYSIHFEQLKNNELCVYFTSDLSQDVDKIKNFFLKEITKDHPTLNPEAVRFTQVNQEKRTLAGKAAYS